MRIDLRLAAALALMLCVSCTREDENHNDGLPKSTAPEKISGFAARQDAAPTSGNEIKPVFNSVPVPAEQLESMEVVLAESEREGHEDEINVFVILYDREQNMASSGGKLDLTYTVDDANEQTKVKDLEPAMFRKQVIPGEEEPSLSLLADIVTVQPGQTLKVTAGFGDLLESDDSITMEDAEAPGAPPDAGATAAPSE